MDTHAMKCPTRCNHWSLREHGRIANFDEAAGIHYGVIHQNDLPSESMDDIYTRGTDLDYQPWLDATRRDIRLDLRVALTDFHAHFVGRSGVARRLVRAVGEWSPFYTRHQQRKWFRRVACELADQRGDLDAMIDDVWQRLEDTVSESYQNDDCPYAFNEDGYELLLGRDRDLFICKSPYVAQRGLCSPCAPNACHLHTDGTHWSYVLGIDWYGDDDRPDYPIYDLTTGQAHYLPATEA